MKEFKRMQSGLVIAILVLAALACGTPGKVVQPSPRATVDQSALWFRVAGESKADQSWAVETDDRGNLYWGTFQQAPGELFTDMVIYKFDPAGKPLWQTRYGDQFQEKLFVLAVSPPYLLVGGEQDHSINIAQADMIVLALDLEDGSLVWKFTYDQGFGYEEVDGLVADGEFIYVSGWTTSEKNGNDVGILKLDRQGKLIWAQSWGGPGWDEADGQMVVDGEYIYITGRYDGNTILTGGHGLLAKFRKDDGDTVKHLVWNDSQFYDGFGMTGDGNYLYVTGLTIVPRSGSLGDGQIFVQKWDKDFNLLWERQWGGAGGDQARAIGVDNAGRIVVAGNSTIQGDRRIVLLVYDNEGTLQAETIWGGAQADVVQGLWIDGEYAYLAGQTTSLGAGMFDALLIRVYIPTASFPPSP
ncbi:MAG: PQQ-binding-like beta-propeller repeat protein [Anaerolineaceae bacterium]